MILVAPKGAGNRFSKEKKKKYLLLFSLLGQEHGLDVGQHTTLSNCDTAQKFVQFLVVADSQLQMTGDDTGLLVITSSVAGKLENLSCEVFHDGSQVHGGTSSYTFGIVSLAEQTMNSADGELQTGSSRAGLGLALHFASLSASRHDDSSIAWLRMILLGRLAAP